MRFSPIGNTKDETTLRYMLNMLASQLSDNNGMFTMATGTETVVSVPNVTTGARVLLTPYSKEASESKYYVKSVTPGQFTIGHEAGPSGRRMAFMLTEIT